MKLITAILKPHKLDDVRSALDKIGVSGMTVTEAKGFGRQKGHTTHYRGAEHTIDFLPKIKLEVAVRTAHLDTAIDAIKRTAHSGTVGDGKIFVMNLEKVVRIRTGEADDDAL